MSSRKKYTAQDWVNAAEALLIDRGVEAVSIDRLAKSMKITRGSFYYYFSSRAELMEAVLNNWRVRCTDELIRNLTDDLRDPQQQLENLLDVVLHGKTATRAATLELAIRDWSRRNDTARNAVDEVDRRRLIFISGLFVSQGFKECQAADLAHLFYFYQYSSSVIGATDDTSERRQRNKRIFDLFLKMR